MEPVTNDNLVTWGYLDHLVQVTPSAEEMEAQRAQMEERLAQLSPEERAQMGARMERQLEQMSQGEAIPIYRVMAPTSLPGVMVRPYNQYEPNRYYR